MLTFIGGAQQVTGSCYLLESPATGRLLLDCGMHQGYDADQEQAPRFAFDPASLDAVVLSHAHLDHSGMLPHLVHAGFRGPIHCTRATARLLRVMLEDALGLYSRDLEYLNLRRRRRGEAPVPAQYGERDVQRVLEQVEPINYRECLPLSEDATLCFHDAGHILGSAIVEITVREQNIDRKLVFSGDLGKRGSVLMRDPELLTKADVVLMEGTYGNRDHRTMDNTLLELEAILHETWERRGSVLIPAFAVGRTQELLFHLGSLHAAGKLDQWQVFLDSPMAIEITSIYDSCAELLDPDDRARLDNGFGATLRNFVPSLRYSRTVEESRAINRLEHGALVIAGSGMCNGGRIRHHLKQRIWNQRNTVIFAGFQARGTLGRALVDGAKRVTMFGSEFAVRARIETLGGFSAHAGQRELVDWITHFDPPPRVMLVHGEPEALDALSMHLWKEHKLASEIPYRGQKIHF